jgi:hypothetical protein
MQTVSFKYKGLYLDMSLRWLFKIYKFWRVTDLDDMACQIFVPLLII